MSSLRDQLLKVGAATKAQAKKSVKATNHAKRTGQGTESERARKAIELASKKKAEDDRAANASLQAQRKEREITAQAKNIISQSQLETKGEAYQFEVAGVVRSIAVSEAQRKQIINGQAAIASMDGRFYLLPSRAAAKIAQRRPEMIAVCYERGDDEIDSDDPYADYQVPDDLIW